MIHDPKPETLCLTRRRNDATLQAQGLDFRIFVASSRRRVKQNLVGLLFLFLKPRLNLFAMSTRA